MQPNQARHVSQRQLKIRHPLKTQILSSQKAKLFFLSSLSRDKPQPPTSLITPLRITSPDRLTLLMIELLHCDNSSSIAFF